MRYYEMILNTSSSEIEEKTTIRLKDYDFETTLGALNEYFFRTLKNGYSSIFFREENGIYVSFAYREEVSTFNEVVEYFCDILKSTFKVKDLKTEPYEITGYEYYEHLVEARRRGYYHARFSFKDNANLNVYEAAYDDMHQRGNFSMKYNLFEKIVLPNDLQDVIYDELYLSEISNIEKHYNISEYEGNLVHYVVSARSNEAQLDMIENLVYALYEANRVRTCRIDVISEMNPDLFLHNNYVEDIIENNYGGTIVFDLAEKIGHSSPEYGGMVGYLLSLLEKYRNKCLFIFKYNVDNPGFSYPLLSEISKYVIPVFLKEGKGTRRDAVKYMKCLIKNSCYAMYAGQAGEFMKNFPGKEFTQTDVLSAYKKFDNWCVNKNIMPAYNFNISDTFMLDRDDNNMSASDKLEKLIGLKSVKKQISDIISNSIIDKERSARSGNKSVMGTMHMIFAGNPGTAKTTVARLFAQIAKDNNIIKSGIFVERKGQELNTSDLVKDAFLAAKGGVLFIDEAYSISGFGVITSLIQEMENKREEVIVVLAGYEEDMDGFLTLNAGLKSRIPYKVIFPDYSTDELLEIFKLMIDERGLSVTDGALNEVKYVLDKARYISDFGNGRYVRNLIEGMVKKQSVRLMGNNKKPEEISKRNLCLITKDDILEYEKDLKLSNNDADSNKKAIDRLEEMVGLDSVKDVIKKAVASFKYKKYCMENGIKKDNYSMHMVFQGAPGTAKTTVARLFAEILNDEGVLPVGKLIEVGRSDLVGAYVGHTAKAVKAKFKEAKGSVLFIDEAYSLCDEKRNSFGDEAINTIVSEMENNREDTIVIFAGYTDRMKEFINTNPGLPSRIAFYVDFENYNVDELCDITKLMLTNKQMKITDAAMDKVRSNFESVVDKKCFGNGRYARKIIEEAEMNLSVRLMDYKPSELSIDLATTLEECDIPENNFDDGLKAPERPLIGFKAC